MQWTDPFAASDLLHRAAAALRSSPLRRGSSVVLPAQGTLLVGGDLHDNPRHLDALRRLAALGGPPGRGGGAGDPRGHLVVHELIHGERLVDGVDLSHRMLLRVSELQLLHPDRVHVLLANHEIAQLVRRGVSKGAGDSVALFQAGLDYVFGGEADQVEAAIDEYIRALPLTLRSEPDSHGRSILCAHSLPSPAGLRHIDAGFFERPLVDADYAAPGGLAYLCTWGRELPPGHLSEMARRLGVTLFCLGHQHADTGVELLQPNALIINSDHERAAAVSIDLQSIPSAEEAAMSALPLAACGGLAAEHSRWT